MLTALVTGTNRGLGLEFVRQYAADGWQVHACCRQPDEADDLKALAGDYPDGIRIHALDVADFDAIDALADKLKGTAIDVLINNAGVFGPKARAECDPRQMFAQMDYDIWANVLKVDTMAPLKMAEAFVEHVAASEQKKIVTISSSVGSIAETYGGIYTYRSSKAAVNMVMATLAKDLAPRGIIVAIFCPGWVKTDMGGDGAPIEKEESIRGLLDLIAKLTLEKSGSFTRFDGEAVPW